MGDRGANINVNAVAPGMVWTPATEGMVSEEFVKEDSGKQSIRRIIHPEDVASAVLFLSSDESDLIIGQVLLVDGGKIFH